MKAVLKIFSFIGLVLTILPSLLFFYGQISLDTNHLLMFAGMILWFVTAPFWINDKLRQKDKPKQA